MQKLVYILPEYREDIGTHFYHNIELLLRVQEKLDIFLIIEKGVRPQGLKKVYVQKFRFLPLRILELKFLLLWLRARGYKTFWTHYSFVGSVLAPFFGKSFYWNCGMPWLYRRGAFEEFIFRLALKRSLLVTGTKGMKRQYIEHYGLKEGRVFVLPNWINLERFEVWRGRKSDARTKLGLVQDAKIVFFLHRLSKRKGAHMIVPVARACEQNPKILFLVAGSGPLEREIGGKNIHLLGEVAQKDVPLYFAACDIFFMPSEEEGFPHVVLEAMAMGVPIVASRVGGVEEIVPDIVQEYVIDASPDHFARLISVLLTTPEQRTQISHDEICHAEKYALDNLVPKFLALVR